MKIIIAITMLSISIHFIFFQKWYNSTVVKHKKDYIEKTVYVFSISILPIVIVLNASILWAIGVFVINCMLFKSVIYKNIIKYDTEELKEILKFLIEISKEIMLGRNIATTINQTVEHDFMYINKSLNQLNDDIVYFGEEEALQIAIKGTDNLWLKYIYQVLSIHSINGDNMITTNILNRIMSLISDKLYLINDVIAKNNVLNLTIIIITILAWILFGANLFINPYGIEYFFMKNEGAIVINLADFIYFIIINSFIRAKKGLN